MHPQKIALATINVVGGLAVLLSYVLGFSHHPELRGALWGGVPEGIRPLYTLCMVAAAFGYLVFTHYVFFRLDGLETRVFERLGFGAFNALYALVLVGSALWMPLTFHMLESPSDEGWLAVRGVLAVVALGSLGLLVAVAVARPRTAFRGRQAAIAGCLAFCLQTVVLDAVVWTSCFPH